MLIAAIHLAPSLGTPGFPGADVVLAGLNADLAALDGTGIDGILLENENDKPHTLTVNHEQLAWLTRVALHARAHTKLPLGINIQRIDWQATFAIAAAVGLDFVRLDTLVDRVRMGGEEVALEPEAVMTARPPGVKTLVDVQVKHAELLDTRSLAESARRAFAAGADAVLVTGTRTGEPPLVDDLRAARVGGPIYIGSGLDADNAGRLAPHCDGAIVGTSLKEGARISRVRVAQLVEAWRRACASRP